MITGMLEYRDIGFYIGIGQFLFKIEIEKHTDQNQPIPPLFHRSIIPAIHFSW